MRQYLALVALAGCYSPALPDCEIACTQATGCPSGFECVGNLCHTLGAMHTCDEVLGDAHVVDGDPALDTDSDGVHDNTDNCVDTPNPQQFDEDRDGVGDPCDPCPYAGTVTDALLDTDHDGVGDYCDPHPDVSGEHELLFIGFNSDPNGDVSGTVAFQYAGGQALALALTSNDYANLALAIPGIDPLRIHYVVTRVHLNAFATGAGAKASEAGTVVNVDPNVGHGCAVGINPSTTPSLGLHAIDAQSFDDLGINSASLTTPPATGSMHLVMQSELVNNSGWQCTERLDNISVPASSMTSSASSNFGLHVRGMSAAFDFIYVVDAPGP